MSAHLALVVASDGDDLARRIDAEHAAVGTALRSALGHAIAAGELLIEARRRVQHGEWRPWLETNCSVPARTARHYMALARRRERLCDQNGNVLPISVNDAVETLKELRRPPWDGPYDSEDMAEFPSQVGSATKWPGLAWSAFAEALHTVARLPSLKPPAARYVVGAARAGKVPGLTAPVLRDAITLLTRYAEALERADAMEAA